MLLPASAVRGSCCSTLGQRATFEGGVGGGRVPCVRLTIRPQNDEEAMVEAVALYNPVSFAFEVTNDFMLYRKGIYSR